jgi:pimeloyl-ACP methyl ester carboxylesterase
VHGYALNLDCWHFQREYFRGKHRMVFYDQRSHGRSGRGDRQHATIDQLGDDLRVVLEQVVPTGPVVLVGHSMGGMTIMALAERHPDLFEERVAGTALISTTAGGLRTHRVLSRLIPDRVGGTIGPRVVAGLALAPDLVDRLRRRGSNIGFMVADQFAFGDDVPASYVEFVDNMLAATSFEVLAEFFPNFDALDKFTVLESFGRVPTYIISGTKDVLTSIGHSRKMASAIPGATLLECQGAGHMVILERKDRVNSALDELFAAGAEGPASRVS